MIQREKIIEGYDGNYAVTIDGKIISYVKYTEGKVLKPSLDTKKYYFVILYKNRKPKAHRVHRLIACAFLPKIEGKEMINHIDGNRVNNKITNLEWCTHKENMVHAVATGLKKPSALQKEVTRQRSKKRCVDLQTGIIYDSLKEACEATNEKHQRNIQRIFEKSKRQRFNYI
jgi:hypothetical protein